MNSVLLIEDDSSWRALFSELLIQQGWSVLEAEDGDAGLKLARQYKPAVIVCDLLMPRCNGYQVCRSIRADPELAATRIIMISGRAYATDKLNAFEAGADEYLIKPVYPAELCAALQRQVVNDASQPAEAAADESADQGPVRLRFWGVRGSVASPGPETVFYGGNTSCVEVRADGEVIVLDAGTGIRPLGASLAKEFGERPLSITVLLSHTHWDHIQGFPFFAPAYNPKNSVRILGYEGARKGLAATLGAQMESPYFPIGLDDVPAHIHIEEVRDMNFAIGRLQVNSTFVNHPGICVGYRLNTSAGAIVYIPDNEPFERMYAKPGITHAQSREFAEQQDARLIEFIAEAKVLIMDSQYDCEEYDAHVGWGHACLDDVVALACKARVERLFMFHHDPTHDDERISRMLAHGRQIAAQHGGDTVVEAAREGLEVVLAPLAAVK